MNRFAIPTKFALEVFAVAKFLCRSLVDAEKLA
jgi:hypothetical protein